mgnify:CR=1 FL=1
MSETEWIDIFGDNLADMLDEANMTQRELADAAGLAESSVSRYVHKEMAPSFKAIINIAYALDCDVNELIDFGDMIE